jgi:hypothetical protein
MWALSCHEKDAWNKDWPSTQIEQSQFRGLLLNPLT